MQKNVSIPARFCGPPKMANGGYLSGLLSSTVDFASPVITLRAPAPLDQELQLVERGEGYALMHQDKMVADVKPGKLELDIPDKPDGEDLKMATQNFDGFREHPIPHCFVCGTARENGDGLRIFTGRVANSDVVAAPWVPDTSLADTNGRIKEPFIWAALDCPGAYAILGKPPLVLLGRICGQVFQEIHANENCTVIGWPIGSEGRKYYSGTAIYNAQGQVCAAAYATWISVS